MPDERQELMTAFNARRDRVERYENTWFRQSEAAMEVLNQAAGIRALVLQRAATRVGVQTASVFSLAGTWLPGRIDTQRAVVADVVAGATVADNPTALPQAVLLLGMPGAGKSSCLRPVAAELVGRLDPRRASVIDADAVRERFPEYRGGLGATIVQVETAHVAYGPLMDEVYRRRCHVLIDTVGDPELTVREAEYLTAAGWSVSCLLATMATEVAVERAMRRAVGGGRYVPVAYLESIGDRPVRAFDALLARGVGLGGAAQFETGVPAGQAPLVVRSTSDELFGPAGAATRLWPGRTDVGDPLMPGGPGGPGLPDGPGVEARMWRQFERIQHALLVRDDPMVLAELEVLEQIQWDMEQEFLAGSRALHPGAGPPLRLADILRVLETYQPGLGRAVDRDRTTPPGDAAKPDLGVRVGKKAATRLVEADRAWRRIENARKRDGVVRGRVVEVVEGGLVVDVGVRGLLPASAVELRRGTDLKTYVGRRLEAKVGELDLDRRVLVLSDGQWLVEAGKARKKGGDKPTDPWPAFADSHQVGEIVYGRVTKLVAFGAFLQVAPGIEGLVHISEMAPHRVDLPDQVVTAGEELWVKIIGLDPERRRVSLSIKQAVAGGAVAAEYRQYLDQQNYDQQGNYVGPPGARPAEPEAEAAGPAVAEAEPEAGAMEEVPQAEA